MYLFVTRTKTKLHQIALLTGFVFLADSTAKAQQLRINETLKVSAATTFYCPNDVYNGAEGLLRNEGIFFLKGSLQNDGLFTSLGSSSSLILAGEAPQFLSGVMDIDVENITLSGYKINLENQLNIYGEFLFEQGIVETLEHGMVTMCVGTGQGAAGIFEFLN